ncbi:MAG: hypothetical protein PGN11_18450 [Quadrisphaera sp.]
MQPAVDQYRSRAGAVPAPRIPPAFAAAMDDDLNVPGALAVLTTPSARATRRWTAVTSSFAVAAANDVNAIVRTARHRPPSTPAGPVPAARRPPPRPPRWTCWSRAQLEARARARAEKDFAAADAIRDLLGRAGVVVQDSPGGARWSLG